MMNNLLSSAYNREDWIDFLQARFLPNDFKLKKQAINIDFKSRYLKPQAYWIGDCSSLDDLAVIEISHSSEHDPRIGVSRDAFRLMAELNLSRALFFFVSENSNNYRFSLITLKLELEGTSVNYRFSNPKRFSFYLGENAKTKTPVSFLLKRDRIRDWEDLESRFSVEVVNKEFYQEIQKMFYKLVGGMIYHGKKVQDYEPMLKLPDNDTKTKQEFGVRLIGRLVFCWFLKKKLSDKGNPIIPHQVLSTEAVQESYYRNVLEPLFFEVLNSPLQQRHQDFRSPLYDAIPFLNGGLFDPTLHRDYYIASSLSQKAQPAWNLKIPDLWFKELFTILETYNFTIDENTSIDIDLSVDPEMLGRIFENLLAELNPDTGETARKASGSFYTPRAIVEYMVDESLIQYLLTKTDLDESAIRDLLDFNIEESNLPKSQKIAVIDALDEIKVLDPACGSGAFPIGILQKMLLILQKVDPESIEWVIRQLDKIPNRLVRQALEEKLISENWKYKHKMGVIQNAIYGVDIQAIATEISKLRLFLSLIVDETVIEAKENKNIHPLPNLSFKFMTANSLISLGEKEETLVRYQKIIKGFDDIRERYLHAHTAHEKEQIKKDFAKLNLSLMESLTDKEYQQSSFLDETQTHINLNSENESYLYKLLSWDPFQDKASAWFDPKWMFGIKDGFDIVIGNPPYIQLQKAWDDKRKFADLYKDCGFASFERTGDIYCLFYERGIQLLSPDGLLCYITSNKWMRANYGQSLRKYLAENTQGKILIDFGGFKVFDSATVDTNILLLQNSVPGSAHGSACSIKADFHKGDSITKYVAEQGIPLPAFSAESWIIADDAAQKLKAKIERIGTPLKDWDVSIYRGVLTGYNEAFIISGAKKDELIAADPRSAEIIKPILRGRDIKRYKADFADLWLIATLPALKLNIDDYPAVKAHLMSFMPRIKQTGESFIDQNGDKQKTRKKTGHEWFETQDPITYYEEFEKEKVVYREISSEMNAVIIPSGHYINNKLYMITGNNLKYLLCVLNSKLFNRVLLLAANLTGGKGEELLSTLRIPLPDSTSWDTIANSISVNIKEGRGSGNEENTIDLMVYKLYELDYAEAKLIDPDLDSVLATFGLSAQDFERMSVIELGEM